MISIDGCVYPDLEECIQVLHERLPEAKADTLRQYLSLQFVDVTENEVQRILDFIDYPETVLFKENILQTLPVKITIRTPKPPTFMEQVRYMKAVISHLTLALKELTSDLQKDS